VTEKPFFSPFTHRESLGSLLSLPAFSQQQLSWAGIVKEDLPTALFGNIVRTIRARDTMPRLSRLTSTYCWEKL